MEPIRILIADDDPGMLLMTRKLIARAEDYQLVGEAQSGEELLALYEKFTPEVVLMDVEMPGMSRHRLRARHPGQEPQGGAGVRHGA